MNVVGVGPEISSPGADGRRGGARGSALQLDRADGFGAEILRLRLSTAIWDSYWSGDGFEQNADNIQHDPEEGGGRRRWLHSSAKG